MHRQRDQLKAFLRARRASLSPETLGLAPGRRRKTPGLRREEVASVADVGITWYTWLEQGREIRMSRDALDRIAAALRLTPTDTAYFLALAGVETQSPASEADVDPLVQAVVDCVEGCPAFVTNPRADIVAFNRLAERVYALDAGEARFRRNHVWRLFADPTRRSHYGECWSRVATSAVGSLRANYASRVGDPAFEELLLALRATGREFVRRWDAQYTTPVSEILPVTLTHAEMGRLAMHATKLMLPDHPGYLLVVQPPADEKTIAAFRGVARRRLRRGVRSSRGQ